MSSSNKAKLHQRLESSSKLNLVALMDIFTILVFFLMVNSSDVKVVNDNKSITLPDSSAETLPANTLTLTIDQKNILVQSQPILAIDEITKEQLTLEKLKTELDYHANRRLKTSSTPPPSNGLPITILGDNKTPYDVLKKVLATCAQTDYRDISLAVNLINGKNDKQLKASSQPVAQL